MFAEVLLHKPEYRDHTMLRPYRAGGLRSDNPYVNFYCDFYAQGKPCYAKEMYPSLEDGIALIKENYGKAVLAHPGINLQNRFDLFTEMIALGIDGVEAFSSYHDESCAKHFYDEAQKHSLLVTCGSDFHGKTKPAIRLGESGCFVEQREVERQLFGPGEVP
jgi:predicted metal-dependent phosphoesterase TrpH